MSAGAAGQPENYSGTWRLLQGCARDALRELPPASAQTCVTSPPYFGLRDYGADGQIGLEATPDEYVAALVDVFREVRRVLADDGTLWLNLGDSYAGSWGAQSRGGPPLSSSTLEGNGHRGGGPKISELSRVQIAAHPKSTRTGSIPKDAPYKPKDLLGIPWMTAFALRADGWWLRSELIWAKPNPMPESVGDRPTKAHEHLFLLTKSARYFYDADAIREDGKEWTGRAGTFARDGAVAGHVLPGQAAAEHRSDRADRVPIGANKRSVWTVSTQPYSGAHFATFPPKLIEPCILAGAREGDTVLDPFAGSGTTGVVALRRARSFIGVELNPEYVQLARRRIVDDAPLLNSCAEALA